MFLKNSRYRGLPTVQARDRSGRTVTAVKLRRLPATTGDDTVVGAADRLDILAEARHGDATRYWHIADANTELEAAELTRRPGRAIKAPSR
ncbi:MAG TPA: LysM domain-containing protein [Burkholderiales bacterium]|nr:LysM domain-containing protein [Burkholderiales bacterium]